MARTLAETACKHILNRYCDDVDFRAMLTGTEPIAKCIAAEAQYRGIRDDEVRRDMDLAIRRSLRASQIREAKRRQTQK